MDTRNGNLYSSEAAALFAGVPREHVAQVEPVFADLELVRVTSGPFKGRCYRRLPNGNLQRDRTAESLVPAEAL